MLLMLAFLTNTSAQEGKSALIISGALAHFSRTGENASSNGFYQFPVDPGLSVFYQYQIGKKYFLSSGISYQMGRLATHDGYMDRFRFGEISVPLMLKRNLVHWNKTEFFMTIGISYGEMIHLDFESYGSGGWQDVPRKYDERYSEEDSFTDLLFNPGISFHVNQKTIVEIAPFLKYRVNDNWMEYARGNRYYGLMINYKFNLK